MKYDDWEWHWSSPTFPKRMRRAQAWVHIAIFLTWTIRMGLHDAEFFNSFGPRLARATERIRAGRSLAMSIRGDVDGALAEEMLSEQGCAFATAYYGIGDAESAYLDDWATMFGEAVDTYSVPPTEDTYGQMASVLDARFEAWRAGSAPPWQQLAEIT
jgi:hypothetical protein